MYLEKHNLLIYVYQTGDKIDIVHFIGDNLTEVR